ncbi:hypothetical protein [Nocardia uniformis]|uniref:hypothetical protein n=1 Tax=Nocardia uniformis TaxID=53432 RepID=UPI0008336DAA|nr:hypothetical protein [Nocardia uniformis]
MSARHDLATPAELGVDDEQRPARILSGWGERFVAVGAFAVAILVPWQVFRPLPQGSQYYLVVFLAATLPLIYLSYRSGWRRLDGGTGLLDRDNGPAPSLHHLPR